MGTKDENLYYIASNDSHTEYGTELTPGFMTTPETNSSIIISYDVPCRRILYAKFGTSSVDIWDVMILIPNVIFLLFLLIKLRHTCIKLKKNDSPMFSVCMILVYVANAISICRCIVSMCVNAPVGTSDRILWLILRFFLLATELSVIVFGFMFGHLDTRTSVQRLLIVTFVIALCYSFSQGGLEFFSPNQNFHNITVDTGSTYYLFGHGGMLFWFISSVVLAVIYALVCILPFTTLHQRFAIPTRLSFYAYCAILAVLDTTQSVGCALLYFLKEPSGWCIIDITAYLYFAGFAPLIYITFLRSFFKCNRTPSIHFSYQSHVDEMNPNDVVDVDPSLRYGSLHHSNVNTNEDEIFDEDDTNGATGDPARNSRQLLLPGWHWHGVVVGVPEVKN